MKQTLQENLFDKFQKTLVPHPQVGGHLSQDFPGDPVFTTPHSDAWCVGSIPGWGTKIPHASQPEKTNK